jgi:hypothetical protein
MGGRGNILTVNLQLQVANSGLNRYGHKKTIRLLLVKLLPHVRHNFYQVINSLQQNLYRVSLALNAQIQFTFRRMWDAISAKSNQRVFDDHVS